MTDNSHSIYPMVTRPLSSLDPDFLAVCLRQGLLTPSMQFSRLMLSMTHVAIPFSDLRVKSLHNATGE